jgi:T5SS/PEP-CTERM-associated repeat protein
MVDGSGSTWRSSENLYVGREGTGTLTIENGGSVSNDSGYLGLVGTGSGTATVDGSGSTWTSSRNLYVGDRGTGTLTIGNGGTVSSRFGYLGYDSTGTGTATVDGAGSLWHSTGSVYVGGSSAAPGGTGELAVANGGEVRVDGELKVCGTRAR